MKPVKWGIISTANIGMEKVIPGMLKSKDIEIVAISSRKLKAAQAAANKLGIPKAYGSYEELLADPEIEAVYNPLAQSSACAADPGGRQGRQACAVRKADRHHRQGGQPSSAKCRKGIYVAEAFMVRHNPQWMAARARAKQGEIGDVARHPGAISPISTVDPKNVRNMADIGGGGIYDIGCYPITVVALYVWRRAQARDRHLIERDPNFKTDRTASGHRRFRRWPASDLHLLHPVGALSARPDSAAPRAASKSISPSTRRPTSPTAISSKACR